MAPTLYLAYPSPTVRAVLIAAKAIDITLNHKEIDLFTTNNYNYPKLQLNPLHTIPTLVDDDSFTIYDSHAIMSYLISKYAKNDSLYPKDLKKRAIVDQRLHFDSGVFFARLLRMTKPIAFEGRKTIFDEDKNNMIEAYSFLEALLKGNQWAAGDFVSIADYSLATTALSIGALVPIDSDKFPNITAWLKRLQVLPEFEVNKKGQGLFVQLFDRLLKT